MRHRQFAFILPALGVTLGTGPVLAWKYREQSPANNLKRYFDENSPVVVQKLSAFAKHCTPKIDDDDETSDLKNILGLQPPRFSQD